MNITNILKKRNEFINLFLFTIVIYGTVISIIRINSYILQLSKTISFPEAIVDITDNSTYTLIASFFSNGKLYLPLPDGVGHVYPPFTPFWVIGWLKLFNLPPYSFYIKIILLLTFLVAILLFGFSLYKFLCISSNDKSIVRYIFLFFSFSMSLFLIPANYSFSSIYTFHVLFLLISILLLMINILYNAKTHSIIKWISFVLPVLSLFIFFTVTPYVILVLTALPRIIEFFKNKHIAFTYFIYGCLISIPILLFVYTVEPNCFNWTIVIPMLQPKKNLFHFLFGKETIILSISALSPLILYYTLLFLSKTFQQNLHMFCFITLLYICSIISGLKIGSGLYNLGIACFFTVTITIYHYLLLIKNDVSKRKIIYFILLIILLRTPVEAMNRVTAKSPRQFDEQDYRQVNFEKEVLSFSFRNKIHIYEDIIFSNYPDKKIPIRRYPGVLWEIKVSNHKVWKNIYRNFKKDIIRQTYDIMLIHLESDKQNFGFFDRCIGNEIVQLIKEKYILFATFESSKNTYTSLEDAKINTKTFLYVSTKFSSKENILMKLKQIYNKYKN